MQDVLISIIVPVFNTARYLVRCLESILAQTYRNIEVVLINDGSTDESLEIARKYALTDKRVRLLTQKNLGITATRIRGIQEAVGEWIGFVDSDDYVEANMYESLADFMGKYQCDMVASGTVIHELNGTTRMDYDNYAEGFYNNLSINIYPTMLHDFRTGFKGLRCFLANKLFRGIILKHIVNDLDRRVFYEEDAMIVYRYCLQCHSVYVSKEAHYHYCRRIGSAEETIRESDIENLYFLYKNLEKAFRSSPDHLLLMRQLKQHVLFKEEERVLKGLYNIDMTLLDIWDFSAYTKTFGKQVLVYGAGRCGQAFYKELLRQGYQKAVVAWVDKNPRKTTVENVHPIEPVDIIKDKTYDFVAVAIKNKKMAQEAIVELRDKWRVPREKIVWGESSCRNNWHTAYI